MKLKISLIVKTLLVIISVTIVIFYFSSKNIKRSFKKIAYTEIYKLNNLQTEKFASVVHTLFDDAFMRVRTLSQIMVTKNDLEYPERMLMYGSYLEKVVDKNEHYYQAWTSHELSSIDDSWIEPYGQLRTSVNMVNGYVSTVIDSVDVNGDDYNSSYNKVKEQPDEFVSEPYWFSPTGKLSDRNLRVDILVPAMADGNFIGVAGIGLNLEKYTSIIDSLAHGEDFELILISQNGTIITSPDLRTVGENIAEVDTTLSKSFEVIDKIASGKKSMYVLKNADGADSVFYIAAPINIGKSSIKWGMILEAPLIKIEEKVDTTLSIIGKVFMFGIIVIILVVFFFMRRLILPLKETNELVQKLADGDVHDALKIKIESGDELGEMAQSANTLIDGLNQVTTFAANIGSGNYNYSFSTLSESDKLGQSIIEMRNSLAKAKDEEMNRIEEDDHLNWASQGLNIFNKVLRVDNQTLERLTYSVIENLVVYLNAHMGGIYIKKRDDYDEYSLISHVGFPKEKYETRIIYPGDGDVGRCILEKDTIFINDVPKGYSRVSSGLGMAAPRSILIVPLISNLKLIGVLEIESLKVIQPYQVAFVEKLAETIASTILTVKINERTSQLLDKSKKQAEELEQQEEEMRQNMEEMQATQEEAKKQELQLNDLIDGINKLLLVAEYDYTSQLTNINDNYLSILKLPKAQLIGKKHKGDSFFDEEEKVAQTQFWENLRSGNSQVVTEYYKSGKSDYWIQEQFIPVKDEHGIVQRIVCIGTDITEQKRTESEIKRIQEGGYLASGSNAEKSDEQQVVDLTLKTEVIDLTYLKMLYKKDAHKIYNILKLYYETLPVQILELDDIYKARDFDRLKTKINGLKSKMSYMGLKNIYEDYRAIERIIVEKKNLNKIGALLEDIKKGWTQASKELGVLLNYGL